LQISNDDQRVLVRALELAIRQVSLEDGFEFRSMLDKFKENPGKEANLDGFRYDYTDNI
jgi:hypothetical protein